MATIGSNGLSSTNSIFSTYGINNKGIGGLASGLDTDSIVEALTTGTRSKIAKQQQQRQWLVWQQTAYRSTRTSLLNFQTKNFAFSGSKNGVSNIRSQAFFQNYKGKSSSSKVELSTTSTTAAGSVTIDEITQLATRGKMTVNKQYQQDLTGDAVALGDNKYYGKYLEISVDEGATKRIRLDDLDKLDASLPTYEQDFEDALQALVDKAVGRRSPSSTETPDGDGKVSIVKVNIDSVPPPSGLTGDYFTVNLTSASSRVTIANDNGLLGVTAGQTNRLNMSTKIGDLFDPDGLSGDDTFEFKVNGATVTVKRNESISTLLNRINTSSGGVKASFSTLTEQFTFTSELSGSGESIVFEDVTGNLMRTFVGAKGSTTITSGDLSGANLGYKTTIAGGTNIAADSILSGMNPDSQLLFDLTIGGVTKTIAIKDIPPAVVSSGSTTYDGKSASLWLTTALNEAIEKEFGPGTGVTASLTKNASGGNYSLTFNTPANNDVTLAPVTITDPDHHDFLSTFSFTGALTNDFPGDSTPLSDLLGVGNTGSIEIQDKDGVLQTMTWDADTMSMRDFVAALNAAFGATDNSFATVKGGKLVLNAADYELAFNDLTGTAMNDLFGTSSYDGTGVAGIAQFDPGLNAEIVVGGQVITSASNTFSIDGISFTVNAVTAAGDDPILLTSEADADTLIDKISEFVDEYNTILETLNKLVLEKRNTKYPPLSDEQRASLTTAEIEKWEEEAMKGLLYNDPTIRTIISELRTSIGHTVEAAGLSLYDIGIAPESFLDTNYDYSVAGKLKINEERLRKAIEQNPDGVRVLFTDETEGIATKLNNAVDRAVNSSSDPAKRGSLVTIAGTDALTGDNTSTLGNKISRIDSYISNLKIRLENEYNRHWAKFTALETAIAKMNSQSSWLLEMGSGS